MCACLTSIIVLLQHGYAMGLTTGDVESAACNLHQFLEYSYYIGKPLRALNDDFNIYCKQLKAINQLRQYEFSLYEQQVIQNLMGHSPDPFKLQGDVFDIDTFEGDPYLVSIVRFRQCDLAFFMCDDENGARMGQWLKHEYKPDELSPGSCGNEFLEVTLGIMGYGATRKTKRKTFLATAKKCHAHVREVVKKGNPNMVNFESLLNAEFAALKGRKEVAKKFYEESILQAARLGCINFQAVANERYADYMAEIGDYNEAEYRWKLAKELFAEWGAVVKVEQIEEKNEAIPGKKSLLPMRQNQEQHASQATC